MTLTVNLSAEVAQQLADKAAQAGQTLETYLEALAERDAAATLSAGVLPLDLKDEEFDCLLRELAAGPTLPHLPPDFSRTDVYADHE